MISGLNCKNCRQKCCEGYIFAKSLDHIILLPLSRKNLKVNGIPLIRITDRIWRCKWFNVKTEKCDNYYNRPSICKSWFCKGHEIHKTPEKLKKKRAKLKEFQKGDNIWQLSFTNTAIKKRTGR